ncbi:hypothetical protein K7432_003472 [Basidiobolus ranarum]|uniref:Sucrose transporter n=1 Tax=Basidiobolus ranarum TaxID=34480 RepID=A0ABR2W6L2_9FUNG
MNCFKFMVLGTVELAYGTPYLLSLGMSKPLMSLVWLAGPLSGLLIQPLVGTISDNTQSRFGRRRPYIVVGGFLVLLSVAAIAYAREISRFFMMDSGDDRILIQSNATIIIAVVAFYILDFSINAVQACCRALILDVSPYAQQEIANAYAGRMLNIGSVLGYFMGFIDLIEVFPMLGRTQMQILCALACLFFVFTLSVTCLSVSEEIHPEGNGLTPSREISIITTLKDIWHGFCHLPSPVQKICNVQFFAWMGWFPFLFYSTTWITEVYGRKNPLTTPDEIEDAIRVGSFALFVQSLVSLATSLILPALTETFSEGKELEPSVEEDTFYVKTKKRICNACIYLFDIHNIYTFSLVFFGVVMVLTYWTDSEVEASLIVILCGISWSIALWVPFALVGEFVSSYTHKTPDRGESGNSQSILPESSTSTSTMYSSENNTSVITMTNHNSIGIDSEETILDAGIVLGIHNMYVVFPQFAITLISTIIFTLLGESARDSVGWVLRIGGISAFIAGYLSLKLKSNEN